MADPVQVDPARDQPAGSGVATPASPLRRWVLIVLGGAALLFVYHLIADRLTPYTAQAYVQTFVVDLAPEVSGSVVEVDVADNRDVRAGQELFRIDPLRFEIAVEAAEAALSVRALGAPR
jgi:multidrug resistance efflux pump